jgi:hypothetical protein
MSSQFFPQHLDCHMASGLHVVHTETQSANQKTTESMIEQLANLPDVGLIFDLVL